MLYAVPLSSSAGNVFARNRLRLPIAQLPQQVLLRVRRRRLVLLLLLLQWRRHPRALQALPSRLQVLQTRGLQQTQLSSRGSRQSLYETPLQRTLDSESLAVLVLVGLPPPPPPLQVLRVVLR